MEGEGQCGKVMRCSGDGGLGGADIILNGETMKQVVEFQYCLVALFH